MHDNDKFLLHMTTLIKKKSITHFQKQKKLWHSQLEKLPCYGIWMQVSKYRVEIREPHANYDYANINASKVSLR